MQMKPAEPEIWLALSSSKTTWLSSRTKRYIVPCSDTARDDKIAMTYRCRPQQFQHYTFLQWLQTFNHNKAISTTYKFGNTLVGLKVLSFCNKEYLFQYLLMNLVRDNLMQFRHPHHNCIPQCLQWYAAAVHYFPQLWKNESNLSTFLHNQ